MLQSQKTKKLKELKEKSIKALQFTKLNTLITIEKGTGLIENTVVKEKRESLGAFTYDDAEFVSKHAGVKF